MSYQSSQIEKIVDVSENALQNHENLSPVETNYRDDEVRKFIVDWLTEHPYRTISMMPDFIDQLKKYVDSKPKKNRKTGNRRINDRELFSKFINNRVKLIIKLIKEEEDKSNLNEFPPEFDVLFVSDLTYINEVMKKELSEIASILKKIDVNSRRVTSNKQDRLEKLIHSIFLSVLLVILRNVELIMKKESGSPLEQAQELLEWDINVLKLSRKRLEDLSSTILKEGKNMLSEEDKVEFREILAIFT